MRVRLKTKYQDHEGVYYLMIATVPNADDMGKFFWAHMHPSSTSTQTDRRFHRVKTETGLLALEIRRPFFKNGDIGAMTYRAGVVCVDGDDSANGAINWDAAHHYWAQKVSEGVTKHGIYIEGQVKEFFA